MNSYFTPENVLGIASYQADGSEGGWYQLDIPGATLDVLPIAVPDGTSGILVQALGADLLYCLSPSEALGGTSAYLTLPAGSTIFLPGQAHVRQFCALLNGGTPNIVVQFYTGEIGPVPQVNIPGAGSGPPGSGTVTSVNANGNPTDTGFTFTGGPITTAGVLSMTGRARVDTDNAVHVMVNGNDATGQRGRLDKPFETFQEALDASVAGDAIVVWPGSYEVLEAAVTNRSIILLGAELVCNSAAAYLLRCSGIVRITGSGYSGLRMTSDTVSDIIDGVAGCTVSIDVTYMITPGTGIARASGEGCTLNVNAEITCGAGTAIKGWERAAVRGNMNCAQTAYGLGSGHELLHYGDISGADCVVDVTSADVTIYGNVRGNSNNGDGVIRTNGVANVKVYGDIIATGSAMYGINVENDTARIDVYGNIQALQLAAVNVQSSDPGTIISIHGDIESGARHGILTHTADITVWGNISTGGLITDANAVHAIGPSTVRVYGHLSSVAGAAAKTSNTGAIIELFGNAHSTGRWGIFCINGGHIIIHGVASSDIREGAYCEIGQLTILGGARSAQDTSPVIMLTADVVPGNLVTLGGACYLTGTAGTLYSVTCQAGGVNGLRSYGAAGNKPLNPSLVPAGTFNVIP